MAKSDKSQEQDTNVMPETICKIEKIEFTTYNQNEAAQVTMRVSDMTDESHCLAEFRIEVTITKEMTIEDIKTTAMQVALYYAHLFAQ